MPRLALALALSLAPLAAAAQESIAPEDAHAVRAVIEAQLDAFQRDDAQAAFALASPGIRETFGDPETFMAMVRSGYAVVYRPRSVRFDTPVMVAGQVLQPVRLWDAEGQGWMALYPMQRQPDGSWRTDGCQLGRLEGTRI